MRSANVAKPVANCLVTTRPAGKRQPCSREVRERYRVKPGSAAEGELVRQHLPLVKTVVGRIAMTLPAHVDHDDLHSAGVVGLLHAVRHYDESNGASFETYARIRIHGAVMDELRRMDCVSRTVREKARRVQAAMAALEQKLGQPPTEEQVAATMKMPVAEYRELLDEIRPVTFVCLDAVTSGENGDDGMAVCESVTDPNQETPVEGVSKRELARLIMRRIQQLPEMQRKVLALYYYEDLRLREIAEAFGLTESRICQIHAQAILAIKSHLQQMEARKAQ